MFTGTRAPVESTCQHAWCCLNGSETPSYSSDIQFITCSTIHSYLGLFSCQVRACQVKPTVPCSTLMIKKNLFVHSISNFNTLKV